MKRKHRLSGHSHPLLLSDLDGWTRVCPCMATSSSLTAVLVQSIQYSPWLWTELARSRHPSVCSIMVPKKPEGPSYVTAALKSWKVSRLSIVWSFGQYIRKDNHDHVLEMAVILVTSYTTGFDDPLLVSQTSIRRREVFVSIIWTSPGILDKLVKANALRRTLDPWFKSRVSMCKSTFVC